jgi:cytidine deaminase
MSDIDPRKVYELREAARAGRRYGWRPYSKFPVAAAVLTVDGDIYGGPGNIECANYTLTKHAEETAIIVAISNGALETTSASGDMEKRRRFLRAVYLPAIEGIPVSPCGGCRQMIWEFATNDAVVLRERGSGGHDVLPVRELFIEPFGPDDLRVKDSDSPL